MTLEQAIRQADKNAEAGGRWQVVYSITGGYQVFPAKARRPESHQLMYLTKAEDDANVMQT